MIPAVHRAGRKSTCSIQIITDDGSWTVDFPMDVFRHNVWSMWHSVCGTVYVNGQKYSFDNAWGYWEGDQGRSFPKEYLWTQCCFRGGSLMLSVADIPLAGIHFTGIIGVVLWKGKEYRLATYLGAKAMQIRNGSVRIVQRGLELEASLLEATGLPLNTNTRNCDILLKKALKRQNEG